jgi:translocation and assembly module TamB
MIVDVSGEFNHLEFLSHYLSDIDSIKGDHDISLTIYGTPNKLYRDGKILINDATIYTILLDNPIEGIKGSGMLVKNLLTIDNLSGHLKNNNENETDNLLVSGNFKMNKFFDPYYNLNIIGDNVFFKTLLGDIEGIVNLDLDIYGRDTITIAGQIEALDAIMYQEFQINDLPSSELDQDELIINYKLNFPISGKFVLRNSQIDAQLGGELSISMFGDQNADYSGELFVREGKFYYYGDIFTITSGYLAFDTKGFNPYLDLSAFTKIQDENITINLVGPLDNPNLGLESSSGFTESDILELLTIRSRFEDQEISSSGIGSQAQSIFVAYLEKELERNFMQISGLGKWGLIEDVSISGTSALIDPSRSQEDLVIKAQVSKNLSLNYSYKRSFSFSNAPYNQVGVELKVNPYFSLIGNVDELGNMHVKYRLRYSY